MGLLRDGWCNRGYLAGFFLTVTAGHAWAENLQVIPVRETTSEDLAELSLNELMNIEITSVSKRAEPLFTAAAAIYALTGDEIRRSGVRTIAEALRLIPGLQVRRTNATSHIVTARGFSGDKLEVLLDGRSVYTPLTSTVFWDVLDTFLPDIDRIEVIRGPGATLWGANAVNGVINIVTKSAHDTVGTEIQGGGGNEERAFGAARTGESIGRAGYLRIYAKSAERDNSLRPDGSDARDGMRMQQTGFRLDGEPGQRQAVTLTGDVYDARENSTGLPPASTPTVSDASGGNLNGLWTYRTAGGDDWTVQSYLDHYKRFIPEVFDEIRDTADLSLEHRSTLGGSHKLLWGAGFHFSQDETGGPPLVIILTPQDRSLRTYSAFVQDQIQLGEDGELTLGSKFEHNSFTGFEIQPGVRLGWTLSPSVFTWGSVARAVRTPNRIDHDVAIFCSAALAGAGFCAPAGSNFRIGNQDFDSEKLIAYEWGLRFSEGRRFSVGLAGFFNDYDELRSTETAPAPFGSFQNRLEGESFGAELSGYWAPFEALELRPFYAYLKLDLRAKPGSTDTRTAPNTEGSSPQQSAGVRVSYDLLPNLSAGGFVRYVDRLPALAVPHYTELNLRLAWRPWPAFELALVGENLLDSQHPESGSAATATQPVPRAGNELQRSGRLEFNWSWD